MASPAAGAELWPFNQLERPTADSSHSRSRIILKHITMATLFEPAPLTIVEYTGPPERESGGPKGNYRSQYPIWREEIVDLTMHLTDGKFQTSFGMRYL